MKAIPIIMIETAWGTIPPNGKPQEYYAGQVYWLQRDLALAFYAAGKAIKYERLKYDLPNNRGKYPRARQDLS